MLSKIIYKFLVVAAFAFVAQVGFSQNYVDPSVAVDLLQEEINVLEADLNTPPTYTGTMQVAVDNSNDKIKLQLMKTLQNEILSAKAVAPVMTNWYNKASQESPARKTKLTLALDQVKALLS